MLAAERKSLILELINKRKFVKVVDLSKELNITEVTVRRDLEELDELKMAKRVHGGAIAMAPSGKWNNRTELLSRNVDKKLAIAKRAYEFINDSDTIMLNSSTSVLELAKLLAQGELKQLSVVTNSTEVISVLETNHNITIFHTGGLYVSSFKHYVGTLALNTINNLRADKCFLGVNGIDLDYGYSSLTFEEAAVKIAMLRASKLSFVLADDTKFGETYLGKVANFQGEIDFLITNSLPKTIDKEKVASCVNLVIATPEGLDTPPILEQEK